MGLYVSEQWKAVPGYEGLYEVSDQGNIRSLDRLSADGRRLKGKPVAQASDAGGYRLTWLHKNSKRQMFIVHRLVLSAFVGPCPEGMEGCHDNGDPADNRLENLRWDTKSANCLQKVDHGTHNLSRLTECKRGHKLSGPNVYRSPGVNRRGCRACIKARERLRRHPEFPQGEEALQAASDCYYQGGTWNG